MPANICPPFSEKGVQPQTDSSLYMELYNALNTCLSAELLSKGLAQVELEHLIEGMGPLCMMALIKHLCSSSDSVAQLEETVAALCHCSLLSNT